MTDSQVKYQGVMETQRHNLAMERLGERETDIKAQDAATRAREADTNEGKLALAKNQWNVNKWLGIGNYAAQTSNTFTNTAKTAIEGIGRGIDVVKSFVGSLFR